jgi:predicted GNAT family N-acyltransferase
MADWRIIQPSSNVEWETYFQLRFEVLRKPWNEPIGSEKSEDDATSLHALIIDNSDKAIAVSRIHQSANNQLQIRFMAVRPDFQQKGIGKIMLKFVEKIGVKQYPETTEIILHARENAVEFYKSNGYNLIEDSYLLFGEIQHYLMKKKVSRN